MASRGKQEEQFPNEPGIHKPVSSNLVKKKSVKYAANA